MIGRKTILTDQQIQEILWFYDKGASITSLSERHGVAFKRIRKIIQEHGILRPSPVRKAKELFIDDPIEGKVCQGMSYSDYLRKAGYKN